MIKRFLSILGILFVSSCNVVWAAPNIELTFSNSVSLTDEVDGEVVKNVILGIENLTTPEVYLYINSPGGSIIDGITLIDYLSHTTKKVICIANYAASMAHVILESCPVRYGTESNVLIQHHASLTSGGGTATELEGQVAVLKGLELRLNTMEAKRIGISLKDFQQKTNLPWVTYGSDSIKQNIIDDIVYVSCSSELYKKTVTKSSMTIFGQVDRQVSACPLLSP